jgi:hypothetical protein
MSTNILGILEEPAEIQLRRIHSSAENFDGKLPIKGYVS